MPFNTRCRKQGLLQAAKKQLEHRGEPRWRARYCPPSVCVCACVRAHKDRAPLSLHLEYNNLICILGQMSKPQVTTSKTSLMDVYRTLFCGGGGGRGIL